MFTLLLCNFYSRIVTNRSWSATLIGWLVGTNDLSEIQDFDLSLPTSGILGKPMALMVLTFLFCGTSVVYYLFFQQRGSRKLRVLLGIGRGLLLSLIGLTLADPILRLDVNTLHNPVVRVLIDGTESMSIPDALDTETETQLRKSVGLDTESTVRETRSQYLRAFLRRPKDNLLQRLQQEFNFDVQAFSFAGDTIGPLSSLAVRKHRDYADPLTISDELTTSGQMTALGDAFRALATQTSDDRLGSVIVFSDFAHNKGESPVATEFGDSPVKSLGVPVYTVGIGSITATDVSLAVMPNARMKRGEPSTVRVKLDQYSCEGQTAVVRLVVQDQMGDSPKERIIGQQSIALTVDTHRLDFSFTPKAAGRIRLVARVQPLDDEAVTENNVAHQDVSVTDEFLRLSYIVHQPTWEWRFIKEVFHRDPLIGIQGFRTFLNSSDPDIRRRNPLFLETMVSPRSEFLSSDVIIVGDVPHSALTSEFCQRTREFVGRFGGGLIVLAGPQFGINDIAQTSLAEMLPVIMDRQIPLRDEKPFEMMITAEGSQTDFMILQDGTTPTNFGWQTIGRLPWYQPVTGVHPLATVLAAHPLDKCADSKTAQPIIARRRFGRGEVVYLAFNETWRLRRKTGELRYRRFWSQLISHLATGRFGSENAIGPQKRFIIMTDQSSYMSGQTVNVTIEAFDSQFRPLEQSRLASGQIPVTLIVPGQPSQEPSEQTIPTTMVRPGVYTTRFTASRDGTYGLRVSDPVTTEHYELLVDVNDFSLERHSPLRNVELQQAIANETGGKAYDLTNAHEILEDLHAQPLIERELHRRRLWSTPLWFVLVVGLMISEWTVRRWIDLR